jgi:hypothetical protein
MSRNQNLKNFVTYADLKKGRERLQITKLGLPKFKKWQKRPKNYVRYMQTQLTH